MYRRKLTALKHPNVANFNVNDVEQFRNTIVWLEDQHIRLYKVEERENLRNTKSGTWNEHFHRYLDDLECVVDRKDLAGVMDWILGWAVHLEYQENAETYNEKKSENAVQPKSAVPRVVTSNPLDNLDFQSDEFKSGVEKLALLLGITKHPDHLVTLKAVCNLIKERLNTEVLQDANKHIVEGKPFPLAEFDAGLDTGDLVLNRAVKILRLRFIQDLRHLQTKINEAIVVVQEITADPKTDSSLGKVGI